jgi:hypothetical protein
MEKALRAAGVAGRARAYAIDTAGATLVSPVTRSPRA